MDTQKDPFLGFANRDRIFAHNVRFRGARESGLSKNRATRRWRFRGDIVQRQVTVINL